jgi:hypothetical protein
MEKHSMVNMALLHRIFVIHLFVAPRGCKVVDGDISPNGWCKEYAMAD